MCKSHSTQVFEYCRQQVAASWWVHIAVAKFGFDRQPNWKLVKIKFFRKSGSSYESDSGRTICNVFRIPTTSHHLVLAQEPSRLSGFLKFIFCTLLKAASAKQNKTFEFEIKKISFKAFVICGQLQVLWRPHEDLWLPAKWRFAYKFWSFCFWAKITL